MFKIKNSIQFVYLRNTSAISLSGNFCALSCKHCNKHYLKHMKTLDQAIPPHIKSLLVSGGLQKNGKSFISKSFKKLLDLKKSRKIKFNAHIGFADEKEIE